MSYITAVQPFSAIIGASITATVSLLIAYFLVAKRSRLTVTIGETENLTRALRGGPGHVKEIVITVDGQPLSSLNRAMVSVHNSGNTAIENKFSFGIEIPGKHSKCWRAIGASSRELNEAVVTSWGESNENEPPLVDPTIKVEVDSFLNPKEGVAFAVFFDGDPVQCKVHCRIPNTKIKFVWVGLPNPITVSPLAQRVAMELLTRMARATLP